MIKEDCCYNCYASTGDLGEDGITYCVENQKYVDKRGKCESYAKAFWWWSKCGGNKCGTDTQE